MLSYALMILHFFHFHGRHLKELNGELKCLEDAGLKIKPLKCKFSQGKRSPSDAKVKAIQNFLSPKTKETMTIFTKYAEVLLQTH